MTASFDVLCVAAALAAVISIARRRAGSFFVAFNQAVVLRAFSNIARYGQPASQAFLPAELFDLQALHTAAQIFEISVPITWLFTLLPSSGSKSRASVQLPAVPKWLLGVTGVYFLVFAISTKTILSGAYASPGMIKFEAPSGGVQALFLGLTIYELYRRVRSGSMSPLRAFGIIFGIAIVTDYSKGATGLITGFLLTAAMMFVDVHPSGVRRMLSLGGVLFLLLGMGLLVREVRPTLAAQGTEAVGEAADAILATEDQRSYNGEGLEERTNGSQTAAHVVECIWLYDTGHDRGWRSYYNPIIYTFQPAFLLSALDITRPREAAWELGDYFPGTGGIFVFGEMYWNGGLLCVLVVTTALCLAVWTIDNRYAQSRNWTLAYCMFIPSLMQGMQYGITYPMRGLANALLAVTIVTVYLRLKVGARRATLRLRPATAKASTSR